MREIIFTIKGQPPTRTAQQKGVRVVRGRPYFYEKAEVKEAKEQLKEQMVSYVPYEPLKGPVRLNVTFFFGTADKKKHYNYRSTRPDVDNLVKGFADCMTELGFWTDDGQIAALSVEKLWVPENEARIQVCVREVVNSDVEVV